MNAFLIDPLYVQADLALLGMLLGAMVNGLLALRESGGFAAGASCFLRRERFLFGEWSGGLRRAAGAWLFLAAAALLQFQVFFANSLVREVWPGAIAQLGLVLDHAIGLCLVLKLVFASRYAGRQLALAWPVYFVLRWAFVNNHNKWFMLGVLFALAAKDVPLRRVLKVCMAVAAACMAVVMTGAVAGIIPSVLQNLEGGGRPRFSFGYGWYNLLGAYLLGLAVMYLCWRQINRLKWFDFALLAGVTVFCDRGPDSRGATVCLVLLIALALALRLFPMLFQKSWLRVLLTVSPLLAFSVSMCINLFYSPENPLLEKLNGMFTGRLFLANQALKGVRVPIAGQMMPEGFLVDDFYVTLLLTAGPVVSALVWCGFAVLIWRLLKSGHPTEAVCCVAFLAHGFMEPHLSWPCVNLTVWLLCGIVYLLPCERFPSFASVSPETEKGKT